MSRILFFFVVLFTLFLHPFSIHGALAQDNLERARSALIFVEHKDWVNARDQARLSGNEALSQVITWQYVVDPDSGASFDEITRFMRNNPRWPDQKKMRIRTELSLRDSSVSDNDIISWFGDDVPLTGVGKMALAEAYMHTNASSQDKITYLLRDAWRNGDFDESQEKKLLDTYGHLLKREDDVSRVDRLLWEERLISAKRVLPRVSHDHQKLYKARMALIENKKTAPLLVMQVPSSLKKDPGLIYDRMRYRVRHDDDKGAREMLLEAPKSVPYPEKWWKQREIQVREAIDERNYSLAKKLLANHGQVDGSSLADATWLHGWLLNEFLNQPKEAYDAFYRMYDSVRYPVSKARAAYWAARAAQKAGDTESAANWFNTAAAYPTTFYGQLASLSRNGTAPLRIPAPPIISEEAKQKFNNSVLTQAIILCAQADRRDLANHLISYVIENNEGDAQAALTAELGNRVGLTSLGVRAAKKALQQNIVLMEAGYPTPNSPAGLPLERALTLAITRQESEFDPFARSPSNALGMMQLLPATAKETAKKNDMSYSRDKLFEPDYNMTLGSLYLARLLNSYDGSYIMAIAAYNAGPGNVRNWVQSFGTPNHDLVNALNWIEKIPFTETRNYVQRVLENLQMYRYIEANGTSPKLMLGEDMLR